jgi:hypothetical protein
MKTLAQWEPRIAVESVDVDADPNDATSAIALITYTLIATGAKERTSVSVTLGG